MGRKEQARSNQTIQEYFDLMAHRYLELLQNMRVMRSFIDTLKSDSKVIEAAYNDVKRLPENERPVAYHLEPRTSLLDSIQKPKVRPSQARKDLLRQLDYDREITRHDVASNYQIGPTLSKDEQERCLHAIKSFTFTQWMQSERSSVLVINGNGTGSGSRRSGLSFLCARLIYSLDQIRFGGKPTSGNITRPEIVPIHFFCGEHLHNDTSESWESPSGVANSLLVQLVSQCQDVDVSRLPSSRYLDVNDANVKDGLGLLRLLMKQLPSHFIVFCIVDALSFYANNDQASKAAQRLVAGLISIAQASKTGRKSRAIFKLLLTAPSRLRTTEVGELSQEQILNIPKTLPGKGGLTTMKWDRMLQQHLKKV
ncbi:hypothetical protein PFICI_03120 [Pestalotiopsis fici W106-1]|uniref:Nephrocystin 3-like N-terminal domain-containing protein n=1 Tax=Pestalotiopsis fici (strain W106-1 / CGMCC3.15140) TaxID=1229662 RepID=W3XGD4_PESFW|nr:uncharacterized protein PFICI_03120 [Pestalotiopsis fici W106-1]ETS85095.1 hypothetical protein PFICI_03120 [Pestalotiopsis fici W106-1]